MGNLSFRPKQQGFLNNPMRDILIILKAETETDETSVTGICPGDFSFFLQG